MARLKAFSLLESLLAMAVLAIVFSAGFLTLQWTFQSGLEPEDTRAQVLIDKARTECYKGPCHSLHFTQDHLDFEQTVIPHPHFQHLLQLEIHISNPNGITIAMHRELIINQR